MIGGIVHVYSKTKEMDPKKGKSDTWKLLEESGLLHYIPRDQVAEMKEAPAVPPSPRLARKRSNDQ